MDIDNIQSNPELQALLRQQGIDQSQRPEPPEGKQGPPPMGPPPDMMETTQMGSLLSSLSEMDDETADSMKDFGKQVGESIRNGTFDAEALSENAPDALKQLAEESGIDLSAALTELFDQAQQMRSQMGSRPMRSPSFPPPDTLDLLENTDSESDSETDEDIQV